MPAVSACHGTCCGVDVHAHVIPAEFPRYLGDVVPKGWPSMALGENCHRHVMIDGKNYRTVSDKCWTTSKRLADFTEMGLAQQAVSPMPELLSYWLEPVAAQQLIRYLNEHIALMVAESSGQLLGLGAVPLQHMDMALKELHHIKHTLGLSGVEIGSNINGVVVGDPQLAPFFEACEALDLAVFVHAVRPTGMDRLVGPAPLQQILAYPSDVGLAAASVLTSQLMLRRPTLRIAFSHGGGTLPMLLPRLEQSMSVFPAVREAVGVSPSQQVKSLYFDTLVFDAPTLRHLVHTYGASQLMIGTDYPFNFHDHTPVQRIQDAGFDDAVVQQLVAGNAQRFLALNSHGK